MPQINRSEIEAEWNSFRNELINSQNLRAPNNWFLTEDAIKKDNEKGEGKKMTAKKDLTPRFSLGWEFEATSAAVILPRGIEQGRDGSVAGESIEYRIQSHLVRQPFEVVNALRELLILKRLKVNESCGFHVHVGVTQGEYDPYKNQTPFEKEFQQQWAAWCVTLAKEVEGEAFLAVPRNRRNNSFCQPWKGTFLQKGIILDKYYSSKGDNAYRYKWMNITEMFRPRGIRTVENRLMGNTKRFDYLLAWMTQCILMGQAATRLISDPSRLDYEADMLNRDFKRIAPLQDKNFKSEMITPIVWDMAQRAGLLPYDFRNFQKFVEAKIDPTMPEPIMRARDAEERGLHNATTDEQYEQSMKLGYVWRGCHCDQCNYFRWWKKKNKLALKTPVETNSPIISESERMIARLQPSSTPTLVGASGIGEAGELPDNEHDERPF